MLLAKAPNFITRTCISRLMVVWTIEGEKFYYKWILTRSIPLMLRPSTFPLLVSNPTLISITTSPDISFSTILFTPNATVKGSFKPFDGIPKKFLYRINILAKIEHDMFHVKVDVYGVEPHICTLERCTSIYRYVFPTLARNCVPMYAEFRDFLSDIIGRDVSHV